MMDIKWLRRTGVQMGIGYFIKHQEINMVTFNGYSETDVCIKLKHILPCRPAVHGKVMKEGVTYHLPKNHLGFDEKPTTPNNSLPPQGTGHMLFR